MKRQLKIGSLILLIVLMFSLAACNSTESKKTKEDGDTAKSDKIETLKVGMSAGLMKPVGIIVGDKLGYFKEEGVNVKLEKVSSQPDATTAVSTGDMDIFPFGVVAPCTYVSQGADMVIFSGTVSEGSEILASQDFKGILKTADDLKGRTFAVSRAETGQMVLKDYLAKRGFKLGTDVKFVYVDDQTVGMQGVKKGDFDFYICNNAMGYIGNQSGLKVVGTVRQFVPHYPCCRQFCSRSAYDNKRDALVKFEIAQLRGYEYYLTEKESTIKILAEYSGQGADYVEASMYGLGDYENVMDISLDPNKKAVVAFYETLKSLGEIDANTPYKIEDHIATDVYKEALTTLISREPNNKLWPKLMDEFHKNND
ncbi:MAG: ABC transporter substrate-binding protein [Oscillospiraceae bacterium]|nr:ABC transporter substrate-binding protein [Oscillospiraceae bacterium]